MGTWKFSLYKSSFFVLLVILAPAAMTGCRTSQGTDKGCCRGLSAKESAPAPDIVPVKRERTPEYGGQKSCPVTGDALGSMGPAIPVALADGQTIYVCCRGCANRVQRDPQTYFRKVEAERSGS